MCVIGQDLVPSKADRSIFPIFLQFIFQLKLVRPQFSVENPGNRDSSRYPNSDSSHAEVGCSLNS